MNMDSGDLPENGRPPADLEAPPSDDYRPTLEEARMIYVGRNARLYDAIFNRFDQNGTGLQPSFCFPAFFFSFIWFVYRKMYVEFAALLLISFLVDALANTFVADFSVSFLITFGFSAAVGLYARYFYWKAVDRKLEEAGRLYGHDPRKAMAWLAKKGGVNPLGAVAVFLGALAFSIMQMRAAMTAVQ